MKDDFKEVDLFRGVRGIKDIGLDNLFGWMGKFKIKVKENGQIKEEYEIKNRITNTALDAIINILDNIDPDLDIKYLAIGTDNSPLNDNDTQLGNEIFRTQFDSSNNDAVGQFTTTFTIFDSEAVATWEEIGVFCGDSATASADTGIMLSRILFNRVKTSLEEIDITRIDKVIRA